MTDHRVSTEELKLAVIAVIGCCQSKKEKNSKRIMDLPGNVPLDDYDEGYFEGVVDTCDEVIELVDASLGTEYAKGRGKEKQC